MGLLGLAGIAVIAHGALDLLLINAGVATKATDDEVLFLACAGEGATHRFPTVHVHHGLVALVLHVGLLDNGCCAAALDFAIAQNGTDVWHGVAAQIREAEVKRHTVLLVLLELLSKPNLEVGALELGALAVGAEAGVKVAVLGLLEAVIVARCGDLARLFANHEQVGRHIRGPAPLVGHGVHQPEGLDVLLFGLLCHLLKAGVGDEVLGLKALEGQCGHEDHGQARQTRGVNLENHADVVVSRSVAGTYSFTAWTNARPWSAGMSGYKPWPKLAMVRWMPNSSIMRWVSARMVPGLA